MPPRHARDEQPRENWPVNAATDQRGYADRITSNPDSGVAVAAPTVSEPTAAEPVAAEPAGDQRPADQRAGEPGSAEPGAPEAGADWPSPGGVDFSTYVKEALDREQRSPGAPGTDGRSGRGTVYRSGELAENEPFDEKVLGLTYTTAAQRAPVSDDRWARSLRSLARGGIWLLPASVVFLALSSVFGAPTADSEPALVSPGTWVVVTTLGLGLWLVGVVALAALAAATRVRMWGVAAVIASALGVALIGPLVGVAGFARPVISRTARGVENDPNIANAANQMQQGLLDNAAGRWLIFAGAALFALGALAVVGTILGSRVLQRHDGWLMLVGVALAIAAALAGLEFLFTLAAMVVLAAVLGLAYTASRIAPDGTPPPAY